MMLVEDKPGPNLKTEFSEGRGGGGGPLCPPGSPFRAGRHGTIESAK